MCAMIDGFCLSVSVCVFQPEGEGGVMDKMAAEGHDETKVPMDQYFGHEDYDQYAEGEP